MRHLTLSILQAGRSICGAKATPAEQAQAMQAHEIRTAASIMANDICPDCLAIWVADYTDSEPLPDWAKSIDFRLVHTDPTLLRARAEAHARIQLERLKDDAAAHRRAQADAMGKEFILTGSNRPADQNPNQQTLF